MKYSIVIPCYNSGKTISKVVLLTMQEMKGKEVEFILVNDASPDGGATFQALSELAAAYKNVTVIDLAKNAGQHNAVMAGLNYAQGDYIIAMDDDMQTHPSQIHKLLEEIEQGWDIVYAYYPRKKHSWYRNLGSAVNFWTVRKLIGKPKDLKTSSFWVIRKFVRDYVIQYQNPYAYLQGLFLRTTQKITCIPVEHFEREEGKSNYNLDPALVKCSGIFGGSPAYGNLAGNLFFPDWDCLGVWSICKENYFSGKRGRVDVFDDCNLLFFRDYAAVYGSDWRICGPDVSGG